MISNRSDISSGKREKDIFVLRHVCAQEWVGRSHIVGWFGRQNCTYTILHSHFGKDWQRVRSLDLKLSMAKLCNRIWLGYVTEELFWEAHVAAWQGQGAGTAFYSCFTIFVVLVFVFFCLLFGRVWCVRWLVWLFPANLARRDCFSHHQVQLGRWLTRFTRDLSTDTASSSIGQFINWSISQLVN